MMLRHSVSVLPKGRKAMPFVKWGYKPLPAISILQPGKNEVVHDRIVSNL